MTAKVSIDDLPQMQSPLGPVPGRFVLEGANFGLEHLTVILGDSPPGQRIPTHRHEYEEVFIVHSGRGIYTVGDSTVEAGPGDVIVIPANVPHSFVNAGPDPLSHTAVHSAGKVVGVFTD